jgi:S-adenosylmethionine hydrolase
VASRVITLLTDFGTEDAYVGIMKGVILGINPAVRLVDLTHEIPPQQIVAAALTLRNAVRFFPDDSIHVAVVDPGVGSPRHALLIETAHGFLIGPDNGVLFPTAVMLGQRSVRVIDSPALRRQPVSQTFHGRDVFAPAAAHLSCGVSPESFGPCAERIVDLSMPLVRGTSSMIAGEVVYIDHFGNLVTNIDAALLSTFPAQTLSVSINDKPVIGPVTAYAAVAEGSALAIVGSWDVLEIAVRNGDAAKLLDARLGTPVTVVCRET